MPRPPRDSRSALAICGIACLLAVAAGGAVRALAEDDSPAGDAPAGFSLAGDAERGQAIFVKSCALCHGEDGSGKGRLKLDPPARDLRDAERMVEWSDWEIYRVIRDGGEALGLSPKMLPWGESLDEQELHDVAVFVRSLTSAESGDADGE